MGVSNRATHAIEPGTADLLMPERSRRPLANRARDVEDACFEAVAAPRDVFSPRKRASASSNVFKSRITQPEADGPVPRDFAAKTMAQGERLNVFGGDKKVFGTRRSTSPGLMFAFVLSAIAAVMAFWLAGGHAPVAPSEQQQQSQGAGAPVVAIENPVAVEPDPVVTSSVPAETPRRSAESYTAPLPRPARIERAGSILMIRPAGD